LKSSTVFIGVGKIWIEIPECKSLKEKRGVIKPLINRIRDKFQVSASEIGHHNSLRYGVIGISTLGNRRSEIERYLNAVIEKILKYKRAKLVDYKTEIISAGSVDLSPDFNPVGDDLLRSLEETWRVNDEGE